MDTGSVAIDTAVVRISVDVLAGNSGMTFYGSDEI